MNSVASAAVHSPWQRHVPSSACSVGAAKKYVNDDSCVWFKSNKGNGYAFLSNFWPDVPPTARKAVYQHFPYLKPTNRCRKKEEEEEEAKDEEETADTDDQSFAFVVDSVRYPTVEHFYHARKYAAHPVIAADILAAASAVEALKRNTAHKHTTPLPAADLTLASLSAAMLAALRAKFAQHSGLRRALLASGEKWLAEVPGRSVGNVWAGRDGQLGVLLMQVRRELREQAQEQVQQQSKRKDASLELGQPQHQSKKN